MVREIPTEEYFSLVREQLASEGKAYVRVTGTSMMPLLHHMEDRVVIVPPNKIRLGDIVLYDRQNGRYALHRVIGKSKSGFSMAGDNQYHIEKNMDYGQIIGVVSAVERGGKLKSFDSFGLRLYTFWVILISRPRIYIHRAGSKILHPGAVTEKGD